MTVRRAPKVRFLDAARAQRSSDLKLIDVRRIASVALDATIPDGDEPKWQHVATEGTFKGYGGGLEPFKFDAGVFSTIVKNFRAHPAFAMGPDGVGTNGLVQWDFHHAAEAPPGEVAVSGAPAQGWVLDLRVQVGADGKAELWALTEWLEPLKSYVKAKKYKWSSVAVALDAVDPITGAHIGPVLTSIAATNLPFIEGMTELAATKKGDQASANSGMPSHDPEKSLPVLERGLRMLSGHEVEVSMGGGDDVPQEQKLERQIRAEQIALGAKVVAAYRAYNVDEAKDCIRTCLGLPVTATAGDIVSSITTLAALMKAGPDVQGATGIDAGKTIGDLRTILGLPLLTMPDEVVAQALSIFDTEAIGDAGASSEKAPGDGESVPGATTTATKALDQHGSPVGGLPQSAKEKNMTLQLSQLAKRLEVKETDEAVASAIDSMLDVRSTLIESLQLDRNVSDSKLANAVKGIAKEAERRRKLANAFALLVACMAGASVTKKGELRLESVNLETDPSEPDDDDVSGGDPMKHPLIQKLKGLMTAGGVEDPDKAAAQIVKTLTDAAQLEELEPEFKKLKSYKATTEAEAEASAVAATLRNYFDDDETHKDAVLALYKSVGREKFLEKYPSVEGDAPSNTGAIAAESNTGVRRSTQQSEPAESPAPKAKTGKVALARKGQKVPEGEVVDISMYPGANDSERAINALKATVEGADKWDYDTVCASAFKARREGRFVNLSQH